MLNVVFKNRFKKDLKKLKSSNRDEDELLAVIGFLAHEKSLEEKFRDHALIGNYAGCRECPIRPDWLLIYQTTETDLLLVRTGSHSELFNLNCFTISALLRRQSKHAKFLKPLMDVN